MRLFDIVRILERVAMNQPAVRMIVRDDVFKISDDPKINYGVFAWQQGTHELGDDGEETRWQFSLFYVDRLTADGGNALEVQSIGVEVLGNIVRTLRNSYGFGIDSVSVTPFHQRFADECAGVYASVRIETSEDGICEDDYRGFGRGNGDFNDDYNGDYN